jgi:AraC-like DNA-binding protein
VLSFSQEVEKMSKISVKNSNNLGEDFFVVNCWKNSSLPDGYQLNKFENDWALVLITKGELSINNSENSLSENDIYIFPPKAPQNLTYRGNSCSYWIHFNGNGVENLLKSLKIPVKTVCTVKNEDLVKYIDVITNEFLLKNLFYEDLTTLGFKSFLFSLARQMTIKTPVYQNIVKEVILAMYSNPHISNDECAKICHMSKDHFIRIFKSATGLTPVQFKKNIIIARAKNLLIKTNLSITSIAISSGFSEYPLYFNRLFKSETGYYPSDFRKQFGEAPKNKSTKSKPKKPTPKKVVLERLTPQTLDK